MIRPVLSRPVAAAVLLFTLVHSHVAFAAWPHNPAVNLPICAVASYQNYPVIASDGAGGAIIAWEDQRGSDYDIYAQHVLVSGIPDPAWPVNGRALCTAINEQSSPVIVSDGSGGAIVAWQDYRSGTNYDIYAQHVLATGFVDPAWPLNGRALCQAANNQNFPKLAPDGAGGAVACWDDYRAGPNGDIYAQRVSAGGAAMWTVDGVAICTQATAQANSAIVSDGVGGAIIAWNDQRAGNYDIYAQHVFPTGGIDYYWPTDGLAICTQPNNQTNPTLVSDGAGGAIIAWSDLRSGTSSDIYAQHVELYGLVDSTWPADGRALCTFAGNQYVGASVSDGAGGIIVIWTDYRSGTADIFAGHIPATGIVDPAWPANGLSLCSATGLQTNPQAAPDGAGGALVTWNDQRSGAGYDIYVNHAPASGATDPAYPTDGLAVSTAANNQIFPMICSDGAGGAIVTWQDQRTGYSDIYAQRAARFGYLGTPEAEIVSVMDVPNDQGGKVKVSFNASYLDLNNDPNLYDYEVWRSVPGSQAMAALKAGARRLSSFAERPSGDPRAYLVGPDAAQAYWELISYVYPSHYVSGYAYVAPTTGDSTGAYNPKTAFMIVGRNSYGSMYWLSQPASGYSVDNIPPLPPAPFTGQYNAGIATLHWNPNVEPDLAGYRLYRGTTSGFTPGPGNLVVAKADTGYADPAASTYWYKLSAIDIHGNESGYTTLLPAGALDAPEGALPRELALERPAPNPSPGAVTLHYALPREARMSLSIYDAAGRRVRELIAGMRPAGSATVTWDLRDESGHMAGAGLYFARLEAQGRKLDRRFAVIH